MNKFVKKEVQDIEISGIRQFNSYASTFNDVVKLTIGELDFDTPEDIKKASIEAINNNQTRYTSNKGIDSLRDVIGNKYGYSKEEVILTVGTTEGLSILFKTILEENDEVIIPTPGYVGYQPLITIEKAKVSLLDTTKSNYMITKKSLEDTYTDKTKALLVTSPNNPTGKVLSKAEMNIIKDFVLEKDILLISDEIYADITFKEYHSFSEYKEIRNNLVLLSGFSKSHAMTGFRIGYVISDLSLVNELVKVHQYSVTSTSTISQYAALKASSFTFDNMVSTLKKRRDLVLETLDMIGLDYITPEGAFYVFFDISKYNMTSLEYCKNLLQKEKVALIPGEYFLGNHKNFVRLSYATSDETLKEALKRIKNFNQKAA